MGFFSGVGGRVRKWAAKDKETAAIQMAKGATSAGYGAGGYDLLQQYGYDGLSDYLRLESDLMTRYADTEAMDEYPEIACLCSETRVNVLASSKKSVGDSGDERLRVAKLSIRELLEWRAANPDEPLYVYALDLTRKKIVPALAYGPKQTGTRVSVIRVTFSEYRASPGKEKRQWSIRCTPNHLFMLRDGSYKPAAKLQTGDRLMPLASKVDRAGYLKIADPFFTGRSTSWHMAHTLAAEEFILGRQEVPEGCVVHHLDEDKTNPHPGNLEVQSRADHVRGHGITKRPEIRAAISKRMKEVWSTREPRPLPNGGEFPAWLSKDTPDTSKGILTAEHKAAIGAGHLIPLAKDVVAAAVRTSPTLGEAAQKLEISRATLDRCMYDYQISRTELGTAVQTVFAGDAGYENHVVVSVKPDGFDDVYDIEVPEHHNFSAEGVFVHNSALDIYSDDSTQVDSSLNRTIWVQSPDKNIQTMLDRDLFQRTLRLEEEMWEISRSLCKYGNDFEELLVTEEGVKGLNFLPAPTVRRVEGMRGELFGFVQDFRGRFGFSQAEFQQILSQRGQTGGVVGLGGQGPDPLPIAGFEGWEVVHFRLRSKHRRAVYGSSIMESARWIWKRLMLLEDAALIYRLQRAPERFAFYVDVGDLPPREAWAQVQRVRQMHRKRKFANPSGTGQQLDMKFDALPVSHCTPIPLLDGRTISIKEMAAEHATGVKHWVYSVDAETDKLVPGEVAWVGKVREQGRCLKITFDDGNWATMAPDHPLMRKDCTYVNAEDLKPGDSIKPLYRKISSRERGDSIGGYELVFDPATRKYRYTHRIVGEELVLKGPADEVLHHKDFNKRNNAPENLQGMPVQAHNALHGAAGHNGGAAVARRRKIDPKLDARLRAAASRTMKAFNARPGRRELTIAINKSRDQAGIVAKYNASSLHEEHNALRRDGMNRYWADKERSRAGSQKRVIQFPAEFVDGVRALAEKGLSGEAVVREVNAGPLLGILKETNSNTKLKEAHRHLMLKLYRSLGHSSYVEFQQAVVGNHKVVSVEEVAPCDHYCMTVSKWHNFSISLRDATGAPVHGSGVVVKNTSDDDFYIPVRKNSTSTRVEVLGAPSWQHMEDVEYFQNKLFSAMKVPKAYLAQDSSTSRAVLSSEDVRFARSVLRVQRELRNGSDKICRTHLAALNIDPAAQEYEVHMTVPSAIFELSQLEVKNARADLARKMGEFVSSYWVLGRVFGLSDADISEIMRQRDEDAVRDAERQAAGQAVANQAAIETGIQSMEQPGGSDPAQESVRRPFNLQEKLRQRKSGRSRNWTEEELMRGDREAEKRAEDKLAVLLKNDASMGHQLEELGGLLRDLKSASGKSSQ